MGCSNGNIPAPDKDKKGKKEKGKRTKLYDPFKHEYYNGDPLNESDILEDYDEAFDYNARKMKAVIPDDEAFRKKYYHDLDQKPECLFEKVLGNRFLYRKSKVNSMMFENSRVI